MTAEQFAAFLRDRVNEEHPEGLAAVVLEKDQDPSGLFVFDRDARVRFAVVVRDHAETSGEGGRGMSDDQFTCGACGGTFPKAWSDEEALAEAEDAFDPSELEDAAVVCDDCWREMRRAMPDFDARYADTPGRPGGGGGQGG